MAPPGRPRPQPFAAGTELSRHFVVEALVRLSEGRMFYLVSDDRPEQPNRKCWDCGHEGSPRAANACASCGRPFDQKTHFLMSVRWEPERFDAFQKLATRKLRHPGLLMPDEVFMHGAVLCSVVRYRTESLMLDEASPFSAAKVLSLAQRMAGLLAFLNHNGIQLRDLTKAEMLIRKEEDDRVLLFDPDVEAVQDGPLSPERAAEALKGLGTVLRKLSPPNNNVLRDYFYKAEDGGFSTPLDFGRAAEGLFDSAAAAPPSPPVAALSDVGLARMLNEDNMAWVELRQGVYLYVVADGMGGHESGEVASKVASQTICKVARERFENDPNVTPETMENILDEAFQAANNTVKNTAESRGNDMGTTLVALMVAGRQALLANVGDSRGYLLRDGTLHQVSRDHSLVSKMVEQGRLTASEARHHPHSNILLRTVGTERNVEIDIFRLELETGDKILMNSDGLWGEVEDSEIEALLNNQPDLRVCARELVRAAHHGGGKDNVTVMIVGIT